MRCNWFMVMMLLVSLTASGQDTLTYAFFGHTYEWGAGGSRIDPRVVAVDQSRYSRIWLGGDICSEAFLEENTVQHINEVFNIGLPTTQYALGNHDTRNGNMEWYRKYTGRETYNVYSNHQAVSICFNTQLNVTDCEHLNKQFGLLKNVCDTISKAKHLFILFHANLWLDVPDLPHPSSYSHSNFEFWQANCDSANARFLNVVYPLLVSVRERGVRVYCILGDTGAITKEFYQSNSDDIDFFASGINNSKYVGKPELATAEKDRFLIFRHALDSQEMSWEFVDLDQAIAK